MQPRAPLRCLLVSDRSDPRWCRWLAEVLPAGWELIDEPAGEAARVLDIAPVQLVLIDAGELDDPVALVGQLRHQDKRVPLVVMTNAPHWKLAKAFIRAGATDYVRKPLHRSEMPEALDRFWQFRPGVDTR